MGANGGFGDNVYRLVMSGDGKREERVIEFTGTGAHAALLLAKRMCDGREAEVFENGRSLGRISTAPGGDFWVIAPPSPRPGNPQMPSSR